MMARTCNTSTWEAESGEVQVQEYSELHESQASLRYSEIIFKTKTEKKY